MKPIRSIKSFVARRRGSREQKRQQNLIPSERVAEAKARIVSQKRFKRQAPETINFLATMRIATEMALTQIEITDPKIRERAIQLSDTIHERGITRFNVGNEPKDYSDTIIRQAHKELGELLGPKYDKLRKTMRKIIAANG